MEERGGARLFAPASERKRRAPKRHTPTPGDARCVDLARVAAQSLVGSAAHALRRSAHAAMDLSLQPARPAQQTLMQSNHLVLETVEMVNAFGLKCEEKLLRLHQKMRWLRGPRRLLAEAEQHPGARGVGRAAAGRARLRRERERRSPRRRRGCAAGRRRRRARRPHGDAPSPPPCRRGVGRRRAGRAGRAAADDQGRPALCQILQDARVRRAAARRPGQVEGGDRPRPRAALRPDGTRAARRRCRRRRHGYMAASHAAAACRRPCRPCRSPTSAARPCAVRATRAAGMIGVQTLVLELLRLHPRGRSNAGQRPRRVFHAGCGHL